MPHAGLGAWIPSARIPGLCLHTYLVLAFSSHSHRWNIALCRYLVYISVLDLKLSSGGQAELYSLLPVHSATCSLANSALGDRSRVILTSPWLYAWAEEGLVHTHCRTSVSESLDSAGEGSQRTVKHLPLLYLVKAAAWETLKWPRQFMHVSVSHELKKQSRLPCAQCLVMLCPDVSPHFSVSYIDTST